MIGFRCIQQTSCDSHLPGKYICKFMWCWNSDVWFFYSFSYLEFLAAYNACQQREWSLCPRVWGIWLLFLHSLSVLGLPEAKDCRWNVNICWIKGQVLNRSGGSKVVSHLWSVAHKIHPESWCKLMNPLKSIFWVKEFKVSFCHLTKAGLTLGNQSCDLACISQRVCTLQTCF